MIETNTAEPETSTLPNLVPTLPTMQVSGSLSDHMQLPLELLVMWCYKKTQFFRKWNKKICTHISFFFISLMQEALVRYLTVDCTLVPSCLLHTDLRFGTLEASPLSVVSLLWNVQIWKTLSPRRGLHSPLNLIHEHGSGEQRASQQERQLEAPCCSWLLVLLFVFTSNHVVYVKLEPSFPPQAA